MMSFRPPASVRPLWLDLKEKGRSSPEDLLNSFEIRRPPIDVHRIARGLGIFIRQVSPIGWCGAVEVRNDVEASIFVDRTDSATRQRFTIAHELGHLMLHEHGGGRLFRDTNFRGDSRETEANAFAAELLMPEWLVTSVFGYLRRDVKRVSLLFEVSEEAMSYRLQNLGLR